MSARAQTRHDPTLHEVGGLRADAAPSGRACAPGRGDAPGGRSTGQVNGRDGLRGKKRVVSWKSKKRWNLGPRTPAVTDKHQFGLGKEYGVNFPSLVAFDVCAVGGWGAP